MLRTPEGQCLTVEGRACAPIAPPTPVEDNGHFVVTHLWIAPSGALWSVGNFAWTVDFAPEGPPQVRRVGPNESEHAFLRKQAPDGRLLWVRTWPGSAERLTVSEQGVTVSGHFRGAVDFDPGPGTDVRRNPVPPVAPGEPPPDEPRRGRYVSRFTHDGAYRGVWILPSWLEASVTVSPSGATALLGSFSGAEDLDPSSGRHVVRAVDRRDGFVTFLTPEGRRRVTRTWPSRRFAQAGYDENGVLWALINPLAPEGVVTSDYALIRVEPGGERVLWSLPDTSPSFGTSLGLIELASDGGALVAGLAGTGLHAPRGKDLRPPDQRRRAEKHGPLLTRLSPQGQPEWTLRFPDHTQFQGVVRAGSRLCMTLQVQGGPYDFSFSAEPFWVGRRSTGGDPMTRVIGCIEERLLSESPF
ncbi:hypothetical protein [Archangium primigenium]|uniref:hypothetical protein n=1 Tax=[Archangium] primigenium TaxID=2792470 RepID=UPI00195D687D|nr:hypothetical protein [Archangium primigenium]MBM7112116.1 hypothetical protein [Archangium primigenium]